VSDECVTWPNNSVQSMHAVENRLEDIVFPSKEDGTDPRACPACELGTLYLRISPSLGAFVACSNYQEGSKANCSYRRRLLPQDGQIEGAADGTVVGVDPETKAEISLIDGPYGLCAPRCLLLLCAFGSAMDRCTTSIVQPISEHLKLPLLCLYFALKTCMPIVCSAPSAAVAVQVPANIA
jgi:hypothetical protein